MIIHHKEDFSNYQVRLFKKLKYSDTFSFIPLKIINKETRKIDTCIFQTPYLFVPYGFQKTINNKTILDLSFLNKENDKYCCQFLKNLEDIFQTIKSQFSDKYQVNHFCKDTLYNECMRLKVEKSLLFNQDKQKIDSINSFSYGTFLIHLHGLWVNDKKIWFQWYLIQGKISWQRKGLRNFFCFGLCQTDLFFRQKNFRKRQKNSCLSLPKLFEVAFLDFVQGFWGKKRKHFSLRGI